MAALQAEYDALQRERERLREERQGIDSAIRMETRKVVAALGPSPLVARLRLQAREERRDVLHIAPDDLHKTLTPSRCDDA